MAPLCNRCCCCLRLSTGCVLIGVLTLAFYVVVGVIGPQLANTMKKTMSGMIPEQDSAAKEAGGSGGEAEVKEMVDKMMAPINTSLENIKKTLVSMSCLCLVVSHLLALAAFAGLKWLLLPFIVMQPIFLIVMTLEASAAVQSMNELMAQAKTPPMPSEYVYYGAAAFGVFQSYFVIKLLCYFFQLCKRHSPQ